MIYGDIATSAFEELEKRALAEAYRDDPVLWARNILGIELWRKQREILESVRDNRATAVAAGHGVGKTYVAAVACMWWVDVHPEAETFIASTAPTVDQVALLWDNIREMHSLMQKRYADKKIDHGPKGYITGDHKWKRLNGSLIGQGRRPATERLDVAFQGRHATYLLAIGDEAVGIPEPLLNALGVIATGEYNRQLLSANPTDPSCAMAKIWTTENPMWTRLHVSVMDSPLITPEEGFDVDGAKGLSGWKFVEQAKADYGGEDDPRYISRVLGQWAFDAGNNVFTEEEIAKGCNVFVRPDPLALPELGCDIARMGEDASFVYRMERGLVWETDEETGLPTVETAKEGYRLRHVGEWRKAPLTGTNPDNLGSSERIHELALAEGASVVKPDASGIGSAVIDGLMELNDEQYVVVEVFGGAAPSDTRAYINMRAEQYFRIKMLLNSGLLDLDPKDEKLLDELRGILFEYDDKGRLKIESKDSMKRRGAKSPDAADALWYALLDVSELIYPTGSRPGDVVVHDPAGWGFEWDLDAAGMPM